MSRKHRKYRNYGMSEDPIEGLIGLLVLLSIYLWFTNKIQFYIYTALIVLMVAIVVWILIKIKKQRFQDIYNWHSGAELIGKLRAMHPNKFEDYIADMYSRLGYSAEQVGGAYDGGVDVVATKDGVKHYIQCKKYITSKVSVGDVRNFAGALMDKLSQGKGIFITTNIFTTEAEKFAEDKPIELIDGDDLLKLIKLAKKNNEVIEDKYADVCPTCGGKLLEKSGRFGKFFSCSNYPKCNFTKNIIR